jgi:hypothetical protein
VAAYLVLAGALISVGPGPHYDEALFQAGGVHMLVSREVPSFIHPGYGWVRIGGRFWPIMMTPYAGAVSFYLLLPVFAITGPGLVAGRLAAALFAAFGLWGVGRLAAAAVGGAGAAVAVLLLAVHPGYLSNTVFNDSGFAYWMAALGAACLALRGYLARPTALRAAILGLACGLGIWTRLNFVWLLAAAALGALIGFGRSACPPPRHAAGATAGLVVGAAPLIGWEVLTRGRVTLAYMASFDVMPRSASTLLWRLRQLSSALLYDDEHRWGMWEGPPLPSWQVVFFCLVFAAGALAAFTRGGEERARRWHRATTVTLLALAGVMIATRLPVREHHFLTLVPLAAVALALAAVRLLAWRAGAWPVIALMLALYLGIALRWDWLAGRGLVRTGGTGIWSDATVAVARYLDGRPGPRARVFDWGFDTSIYVLTNGRVRVRELFWHDLPAPDAPEWRQEIVAGGVYAIHGPLYVTPTGAAATVRFQEALARSSLRYTTRCFNDRMGRPHTELIEVQP